MIAHGASIAVSSTTVPQKPQISCSGGSSGERRGKLWVISASSACSRAPVETACCRYCLTTTATQSIVSASLRRPRSSMVARGEDGVQRESCTLQASEKKRS